MSKKGKMRFEPMEKDMTIHFDPAIHSVEEGMHLHFAWAKQKCPICDSVMMFIWCPTNKHEPRAKEDMPKSKIHNIIISCTKCDFVAMTGNISHVAHVTLI